MLLLLQGSRSLLGGAALWKVSNQAGGLQQEDCRSLPKSGNQCDNWGDWKRVKEGSCCTSEDLALYPDVSTTILQPKTHSPLRCPWQEVTGTTQVFLRVTENLLYFISLSTPEVLLLFKQLLCHFCWEETLRSVFTWSVFPVELLVLVLHTPTICGETSCLLRFMLCICTHLWPPSVPAGIPKVW